MRTVGCRLIPAGRYRWVVVGLWLATVAQAVPAEPAEGPLLVVPACNRPLEIAVSFPSGAAGGVGVRQLRERGPDGVTLPADIVPAVSPEGTVATDRVRLVAVIPPRRGAQGDRCFHVLQPPRAPKKAFRFGDVSAQSLGLWEGDRPVLVYNHGVIVNQSVPKKDPRRSRACYVHPLFGLSGEILTDDFPRDHYHHHGVFWTWPHVRIEGQEYDLWADRGIRQRFTRWLCRHEGTIAAVLSVENGWFVDGRKVMIERIWLRVYRANDQTRAIDLEMVWIPVGQPVTLWGAPGKSYGGLTVRFAPPSRNDPATVITVPSGPTKDDLLDTPLEWADFTSLFGSMTTPSGAAIFVHPHHPDFPPTWLTRHYGPLCVGWPGVRPKTFPPGKPFRLEYRIWIHKGPMPVEKIAAAYQAYRTAVLAPRLEWP